MSERRREGYDPDEDLRDAAYQNSIRQRRIEELDRQIEALQRERAALMREPDEAEFPDSPDQTEESIDCVESDGKESDGAEQDEDISESKRQFWPALLAVGAGLVLIFLFIYGCLFDGFR